MQLLSQFGTLLEGLHDVPGVSCNCIFKKLRKSCLVVWFLGTLREGLEDAPKNLFPDL